MTEHTPGPWHLDPYDDVFRGDNGRAVCDGNAVTEADARLIAAAPDLLEAVEWARNLLRPNDESDLAAAMDAAIRKARGKVTNG